MFVWRGELPRCDKNHWTLDRRWAILLTSLVMSRGRAHRLISVRPAPSLSGQGRKVNVTQNEKPARCRAVEVFLGDRSKRDCQCGEHVYADGLCWTHAQAVTAYHVGIRPMPVEVVL